MFDADWQHHPITVHQANLMWSPDNSREKLLALLHDAHLSIKLYEESITDYAMVGALADAARNGARVEILTSMQSNKTNGKKFHYLEKAGVVIRISKHLIIHAKVLLIDRRTAVIGSINMTKPSIDDNRELAVITHDAKIYQQIEQTFDEDWQDAIDDNSVALRKKTTDYPQPAWLQVIKLAKMEKKYLRHVHHKKYSQTVKRKHHRSTYD